MSMGRRTIRWLLVALGAAAQVSAQAADDGIEFFEKSIRPILVQHCYECHSQAAAEKGKLQAGLLLDSKQGVLTGGESGPAIVAGKPDKSLLIGALKYESYEMPPKGRLPASVIADFEKWVKMGAPDLREAMSAPAPRRTAFQITAEDWAHWAFQSLHKSPPPKVHDAAWVRDDLDRYVLAKLEQAGRRPSGEADRAALMRRTTFALTGLAPTPEEIAAFIADDRSDGFERVVDRLLKSPEFGVHWGRHWLDGVRYADNIDKSGEYRRWVVRAFNDDLPYDKFLKLQIAGDLIPADETAPADRVHESGASLDGITATGMMSLAVWEQVGRDLAVAEIVDSQIDLVGRQLLGLTLACARCHDHKFDPISTKDYYSLAGVLFSSHIATGKLIADDRLGTDLVEVPLLNAEQAAANRTLDEQIAEAEEKIASLAKKIPQAAKLADLTKTFPDLEAQLAKATTSANKKKLNEQIAKAKAEQEKLTADQKSSGWEVNPPELQEIATIRAEIADLQKQKFKAPSAVSIREGGVPGSNRAKIGDAPIYLRGEYTREGEIVPRRFPTILAGEMQIPLGERTQQSGRRELAEWIASAENPLTARVMVNRVWQQLIGRGLVRSPDNFGKLGERPTHPELLDHLAQRFLASGWSVKQLVREIVLSATFRQASFVSAEEARLDPDNAAISHMNRRRLTYEELRDSLLRLGRTTSEDAPTTTSAAATEMPRRTMYEALDRRKTDVTAAIFDGPDSKAIVPFRAETTTAPQALFLMNNALVVDTAKRLAAQLQKDPQLTTDSQRLDRLWLLTLGRPPETEEMETAFGFIGKHSWEGFVQALLGSNEFAYLD
ncbi:Planctomycete cytochrome C [Anatilimnocola aggregata]|uniref:Planctomycete cytochrome C n=2 Tax=Anatilimnocola aggregata TaxID=2528021 RepID=A0A517YAK3_9BACT|nr:Planctomycete cytochrome C [Anatilimnocola aggregata]